MFGSCRPRTFMALAVLAFAIHAFSTTLFTAATVIAHDAMPGSIVYRVNAGGAAVTSTPDWSVDTVAMPSPHSNAAATGNKVYTTTATIDMTHASLPTGTPSTLFKTERYVVTGGPTMEWDFPVAPGTYEVRLYFAELFYTVAGSRIFDVAIEGTTVLPAYDIVADVGPLKAVMRSFTVTADGNVDIDLRRITQNPKINAIEIVNVGPQAGSLVATPSSLAFGSVISGQTKTMPLQLTNPAAAGAASIVVDLTSILGTGATAFSDSFDDAGTVTLAPGQSTTVMVTFAPTTIGSRTATLEVGHSGTNNPLPVALSGTGSSALPGLWQSLPGSGQSRQEVAYVQSGGRFYLAGGSTAHQAYDPVARAWTTLPSLPANVDHVQAVTLGGHVYYIGGLLAWPGPETGAVHIYDPASSSFAAGVPMSRPRGAGGVAVYGGKIFYAGGLSAGKAVPWFDVYDPATMTWTALPDMPGPRDHFHAAIVGTRLYVIGGRNTAIDATVASTIAYDFTTGTWQTTGLAPLPTPRGGFGAAVVGSEIFVIGGEGGGATYSNVEAYDTASNTWRSLAPMPTPRHGIQAAVCNGGIYIAAGGRAQGGGQPSSVHEVLFPAGTATTCGSTPADPLPAVTTVRINAGGASVTGTPAWSADTTAAPSPYVNATATGNKVYTTSSTVTTTHPSIPAGTPASLFKTERYVATGGPTMEWNIPVNPGSYEVRLYFAELFYTTVGARVFNVAIEGATVLASYDVVADVGAFTGVTKSFVVTADSNLDIDFSRVTQNPKINAIEIVPVSSQPGALLVSPSSVSFGSVLTGQAKPMTVQVTNGGRTGDPSIVVDSASIAGMHATQFSDSFNDAADVTLAPGQSANVTVTFAPTTTGIKNAQVSFVHSAANSPVSVPLTGTGASAATVGFGKSTLTGTTGLNQPTSLQFGPDGRLYVGQQNGVIRVFTVARKGANSYAVSAAETLTHIQQVPNHDDSGVPNTTVTTRLITGILVAGTATQPVIYVAHSDPRIGAGPSGTDLNLDTNSSMISRLTRTATGWQKLDLVRGLPRSEENHAANGMQLDAARGVLYVAMGGNTNMGGPSNNFALLPEFALSAAILSIDLNAIGNTTYDLPTLDDEMRAGTDDANDPFGGNNGLNQARVVPGGPVQVYAPGFRNPYDVLISQSGLLYTIDNGANSGWGGVPVGEGPGGTCTNGQSEPGSTSPDSLHLITGPGYYGGHPNPTRANVANKFNASNPQSPVPAPNAVECDYRAPGAASGALATFPASTNGLTEYTTGNFEGSLQGDLLAAAWNNTIYRIDMNASGTQVVQVTPLFSTVGIRPLDVQALGPTSPMPGTVWVGDHGANTIIVFEPNDFGGGSSTCTGVADAALDEDRDGYDNKDEVDNGTNACSAADVPPDWDKDLTSDRNDADDDNDAVADQGDVFALDAANGLATSLPVLYTWENDAVAAGGILNLGFTGLMTNGTAVYSSQFDPAKMTAGGAAGVLTVDEVAEGDAFGTFNSQQYGFQFGVPARPGSTDVFTVRTRVAGPFQGLVPQAGQSMGLFVGTGTQDDYAKLVVGATTAGPAVEFITEVAGTATTHGRADVALPGPDYVDLYLRIDPDAATVQAFYAVTTAGITGVITRIGSPRPVPAAWFSNALSGLAVGILSTSRGAAPPFPATWDFMEVAPASATPSLQVAPTPVVFAEPKVGESRTVTLTLTNGGSAPARNLVIDRTSITGVDAAQFGDGFDDASNVTLAPGMSTSLTVTFTPTLAGDRAAILEIVHSGSNSPMQVPLSGTGVSAAPLLVATPASVSFADTGVGQQRNVSVTLTNTGGAGAPSIVVDATTIAGTDAAHFSDAFDDAGAVTLAPGASTTVVVSFAPTSAGSKSATLTVAHSGGNTPLLVPLSGTATQVTAILTATPSSFDFGKVGIGQARTFTVTLTNAGTTSIVVDATSIGGANASQFTDAFNDAGNVTLAPGQSTTVAVTFVPTSPGGKSATLSVIHSGSNSPLLIPLAGNGSGKPK